METSSADTLMAIVTLGLAAAFTWASIRPQNWSRNWAPARLLQQRLGEKWGETPSRILYCGLAIAMLLISAKAAGFLA